ncbi:MAG: hypothetical protein JNN30_22365 [Rhodanobacteraceae bacterium]|nr:hypothetical protein [Rhodanobacteraceae bacterium]
MTGSATIAFAHALRASGLLDRARDFGSPLKIENQLIFDNDIQGAENEQSLRNAFNQPMSASSQHFGFELDRPFSIKTEQDEPLLLLADFAAGIVHASFLPEADEHLPLNQAQALELRNRLQRAGLLALHDVPFDVAAADVYGDLADED